MAVRKRKKQTASKILGMGKARLIELTPNDLDPAIYNPRTITPGALDGLAHSMKKFGCVEPIIVNIRGGKRTIVSGHQRHKVMLEEGVKKCTCIVVDLSSSDEKVLNATMNNPALQGDFIAGVQEYIGQLRRNISKDSDFFDLRLNELTEQIVADEQLAYRDIALKPFKKAHVLLSFPAHKWPDVKTAIIKLIRDKEIEYEQGAN